ncbi:MAG: hypothetical protein HQL71_10950 [Magnetococcales bacterium]|nr:hypothetical protein [Magnetococcales bacterium]
MMQQKINFFHPQFLPKKNLLSAVTILTILAALILTLSILSFKTESFIKQQTDSLATLQQKQEQITKNIYSLQNSLGPDSNLLAKERSLREKIVAKETFIEDGIKINVKNVNSFAYILEQIAQANIEGIWLTNIAINNQDQPWTIEGYAKRSSPDLITKYIQKLASTVKHQQKFSLNQIGDEKNYSHNNPQSSQSQPLFLRLTTQGKP